MAVTFSWNAKTDKEKKFIADQKKDLVSQLKAKKVASGEAVSTRSDRVDPTIGGNILRSTIKPTATLLARPVQLVKALQGKSVEDQTIKSKYLGDIKTSTSGKDVVKDIGRGLETVSLGLGLGAAEGATTAANIAKSALEGAASGYLQGVGHGIEEGKKLKDVAKEGIISTGVGALGGAALAGAAKIFSLAKPKITTPAGEVTKAEQTALTKAAEKRAFGDTGKPYIPPAAKAPVMEKRVVLNKDGTPVPKEVQVAPQGNVVTKKGNIAPQITVGKPNNTDQLIQEARKYKSAEEFVSGLKNEVKPIRGQNGILDVAKTEASLPPVKEGYERFYRGESPTVKHSDVWNESEMRVPEGAKSGDSFWLTPELNYADYYRETYGKDAKIYYVDLPKGLAKSDPRYDGEFFVNKSQLTDIYNKAVSNNNSYSRAKTILKDAYKDIPEQVTGGKIDDIAANGAKLIESDPDRAFRIAMGKELPRTEDGVTPDAVYRLISANADGDNALELAQSPVPSRSGINLVTNKLGERGSLTDKIREINGVLSKTLDKKQSKAAIEELTTAIRETAPSKEEIQSLIDELTCK